MIKLTRRQLRQLLLRETALLNESNFNANKAMDIIKIVEKALKNPKDRNAVEKAGKALDELNLMIGDAFLK